MKFEGVYAGSVYGETNQGEAFEIGIVPNKQPRTSGPCMQASGLDGYSRELPVKLFGSYCLSEASSSAAIGVGNPPPLFV